VGGTPGGVSEFYRRDEPVTGVRLRLEDYPACLATFRFDEHGQAAEVPDVAAIRAAVQTARSGGNGAGPAPARRYIPVRAV
jgi:hypothetical protein